MYGFERVIKFALFPNRRGCGVCVTSGLLLPDCQEQPAGGAGALTRLTRTAAAATTTAALSTIANSLWPLFYYLPQSLTLALRCETAALIISAAADGHLTPPLVNNELSSSSAALLPLPVPLISGCSILLASASSSLFAAVCFKRSANFYSYLAIKYVQRHVIELNPVVFSKLLVCGIFFGISVSSFQNLEKYTSSFAHVI